MKRSLKFADRVCSSDGETWSATIEHRFHARTWRFGAIHQCMVDVDAYGGTFSVSLRPGLSRMASAHHAVHWVKRYLREGPSTPEEIFRDQFQNWKTLYRTRLDVLQKIFFVGGYAWIDGGMISLCPEEHAIYRCNRAQKDREMGITGAYRKRLEAEERALRVGPLPDDGAPRAFHPVNKYSLIHHVPHDVSPEWFCVAREAALALRDRSAESRCAESNRQVGAKVAKELWAMLPRKNEMESL